jgi:hypothetical protein
MVASKASWQRNMWRLDPQRSLVWRVVSPRRFAGLLLADLQQAAVDLNEPDGPQRPGGRQPGSVRWLLLRSALLQAQAVEMASTGPAGYRLLLRRLIDYAAAVALTLSQAGRIELAIRYFLALFELLGLHGHDLVPQAVLNDVLARYCALALEAEGLGERQPAEALDPAQVAWQIELASYESPRIRRQWIEQVEALGQANPLLARALATQVRALSAPQPELRAALAEALETAARSGRAPVLWRERPVIRPHRHPQPAGERDAAPSSRAAPLPHALFLRRLALAPAGAHLRTWWRRVPAAFQALPAWPATLAGFASRVQASSGVVWRAAEHLGRGVPLERAVHQAAGWGALLRRPVVPHLRLPSLPLPGAEWRRVAALGISALVIIALTVYPEVRARMSRPDAGLADQLASAPTAPAAPAQSPAPQTTQVPITRQTVLTAAQGPYLVRGLVTIGAGMELHIEAGTVVAFAPGASLRVDGGRLSAAGSPSQPILLTSLYDPAGGAAADRSERAPQPGDWGCICITAASGTPGVAELAYVILRYGGGPGPAGEQPAMLVVQDSVLSLQSSEVSDSFAAGVALLGNSLATIVDSRFGSQARGANARSDLLLDERVRLIERDNHWQPPQRLS